MKPRQLFKRFITRRRLKWAGAVLSVVILAAFVVSMFYRAYVIRLNEKDEWFVRVDLAAGGVRVFRMEWPRDRQAETMLDVWNWGVVTERGWTLWKAPDGVWGMGLVFIPLWIPLLLVGLPMVWLWRIDRRAKAWQCAKCRYDLRGIDGAICPECGARAKALAEGSAGGS